LAAVEQHIGFAVPMLIGTAGCLAVLIFAVFLGPETKGKVLSSDIEVIKLNNAGVTEAGVAAQ